MMTPRHYSYSHRQKLWIVEKRINGHKIIFGSYKTETEAIHAVKLFNKYGWDKKNIWLVKAEAKEMMQHD